MSDKNEVQVLEPEVVMTESEKNFAVQVLKDVNSSFDLATTVMAIKSQISIPKDTPFKVTGTDVMQFMGLARAMHLNPIMGGIYGFKDKKSGHLTLGVSKKGWQQALESQPDYAGITWVKPEMQEKRVSDGRSTFNVVYYPWVKCIVKKILRNGAVGEFEGTAYFDEEFDANKPTWSSKPKRMLETRALTIAASNAYGWGAYEPDEVSNLSAPAVSVQSFPAGQPGQKEELIAQISRAATYADLIHTFKAAPIELQQDANVIEACKNAKAELKEI